MQGALDAVRGTGSTNVVTASGINWANDLSQWLAYKPVDALNQLVAEAHVYGNNGCGAQNGGECLTRTIDPVAQVVPVLFGETGETYDDSSCTGDNMRVILPWADARNIGYAAWTWNTWGTCLSLITAFDGTVRNSGYAQYVKQHLLTR